MNIDALIAQLTQAQTALGDGRDCRSENEKAAYWTANNTMQRAIGVLKNVPRDLDRTRERLAGYEEQRQAVVDKQRELEQAISDASDWHEIRDGRARDKEHDRQRDLYRALERLRDGTLLQSPGVTYARLDDLDAEIAKWRKSITRLQAELDAAVRQAETLLGVTT